MRESQESWLVWFFRGILMLGFLLLLARLIDLQVIKGAYFRDLSEGNRIRKVPITAPRGRILARGGEVLVGSKEIKKKVIFEGNTPYKKEVTDQDSNQADIISEWEREYLLGSSFAHLSGFLGEVSQEEVGKVKAECPEKGPKRLGQWVGRGGLEEKYECLLSGIDGEELIEVDASGRMIRTLGRKNPQPGSDLKTTIDYGLQEKVASLMQGKKGAVVVSDPQGEIIALYSSPSFNPNHFVGNLDKDKILEYINDKSYPLLNRAIGGRFHPGSTFKPIVAVAGLQEGKIGKDEKLEDRGVITLKTPYGVFSYSNWYFTQYGGVEGSIDIVKAIARSTDTFFYQLGERLGADLIADWAKRFGLGDKTQIDLPGEISGLIPSPSWKLEAKGERWFLGNTYHFSIGQGDIAVTPIALNSAIAAIANAGKLCTPHLTLESKSSCKDLGLDLDVIETVKKGMLGACSQGGTGYTFFDFKDKYSVDVACKTGTAETENGQPHAWFVAFAPLDNPEIIATVLVEEGGEGSRVAGPIAREIFNYWFGERSPKF